MGKAVEAFEVLIVGSGFAGLGMAIRMRQEGFEDFVILERDAEVGGTWRDNTYPGVACDVPSHLYSYSFEPNPNWGRMFAPQAEILEYLKHCSVKYGVRDRIRFNTAVVGASWDESTGLWSVETSDGKTLRARVVISGSGHALSKPVLPDIPGRDRFAGKTMHSARWDHDYALAGKRVAVVGTGASAIQIVPNVAPTVGQLFVYQRTAPWVTRKVDRPITDRERALFTQFPLLQKTARTALYWIMEAMATGFVVDPRLQAIREHFALKYLEEQVPDPVLRAKLTPRFRMGCKRVLFSNEWYSTLQRDNVELVTEGIREIKEHSIVTADGVEREVDCIVYATGFETADAKPPFPILGRGGRDLADAWKDGIEAYCGMSIAGFPNLFLIIGPNNGLGHTSMIFMMESQFTYLLDMLRTMRAKKAQSIEVRADVQKRFNERLQQRLARTVWNTGGCNSWYLSKSGKNTVVWPGFTWEYRLRTRRFDVESYQLTPLAAHAARRASNGVARTIEA